MHKLRLGWVTSYFETYEVDSTVYHISLTTPFEASIAAMKLIAEIANCNYLEAKKLIETAPSKIFSGVAVDIMNTRKKLNDAGISFIIEPVFPY